MRAVLFDLDGVLVDSYEIWFAVLNATAEALGCLPISREAFQQTWGQGVSADVERFFSRHGVDEVERRYDAEFPRHLEHLVVAPEAAPLLETLHARGLGSAVVTNSPARLARAVLERAGLAPRVLVGGSDVPRAKPAPDMLLQACARLGVPPGQALLVGDSRFDREAARAAGVRFVGLGIDGDVRLERLGDLLALLPAGAAAARA